ncbi:septal ring lytic transglycosylase RlpA family protein [Nocardiopsis sp. CNT-189]|uniref:septal ring lytic transglycosylase RlpA family protein n=1 Tax=Nocardiopsis oceanisediminis TaxID=2816862 RepID=UPI003B3A0DAA
MGNHTPSRSSALQRATKRALAVTALAGATLGAAGAATAAADDTAGSSGGQGGTCQASMYGEGRLTASGEAFDPGAMTAAHKELPFGTQVEVTNTANGKSVTVTINDRGPFVEGRCLDLSTASFQSIASTAQGVADVEWKVVG